MSNWINFEIKGKKCYLLCRANENNELDALLYDGHDSWYEKQSLDTIVARVKQYNRRIQYDQATIKETLQSALPSESIWLIEDSGDDNDDEDENDRVERLKLKYLVKTLPFYFIWHFRKQTEHDFQKFILFPLFRIVQGLTQQNKELREVIRKKDVEIKQYKFEFGALKRVTVSTQLFNAGEFDERFTETIELTRCMMQISDLLKAQYTEMKTPLKAKSVVRSDDTLAAKNKTDVKLTPRARRRQIIADKQRVIVEKMQALNKPFVYESSQSQASTNSHSDKETPSTSKRTLRTPRKSELKIENDLDETPTKKSRIQESTPHIVKRNLNAGIEYDTSSEDEKKTIQNTKRRSPTTQQEKVTESMSNLSPTTRSRASTFGEQKSVADIFDFNDNSDDDKINDKTNDTACKSNSLEPKAAVNVTKSPAGFKSNTRLTRKKPGIIYDDSSESPAEENSQKKSSLLICGSPSKNSNSNLNLSPEQISNDVQNLIDEWKALEKRRIEDLKIQQK